MVNITLGRWERDGNAVYALNRKGNNRFFCAVQGQDNDNGQRIDQAEVTANAEFICTCANICQSINPSNPLAVAQNIRGMYDFLKAVVAWMSVDEHVSAQTLSGKASEVLTAIEREK